MTANTALTNSPTSPSTAPTAKWLVMKFGGTSLGSAKRLIKVGQIIANAHQQGHKIVVVVSALSSQTKDDGTTNKLLAALQLALQGESFIEVLKDVADYHRQILKECFEANNDQQKSELYLETEQLLDAEINHAENLLKATQVLGELTPRGQDLLICSGERLSALLLTTILQQQGLQPRMVDLSCVLPKTRELQSGFFQSIQTQLAQLCTSEQTSTNLTANPTANLAANLAANLTPNLTTNLTPNLTPNLTVATGFFGLVPGGILQSVGRGYSDFTAALIVAGLGKQQVFELQMWKEVAGIHTADPCLIKTARPLPQISPAEAAELIYFGSQVLHPFSMECVISGGISIRVMNTLQPENAGTIILKPSTPSPYAVTAVTVKSHISVATIYSNHMFNAYGFMTRIFACLGRHQVIVDLVATSEVSVSFTVEQVDAIERARKELEEFGSLEVKSNRAILAIVGEGLRDVPGMAGRMFSTLGKSNINVELISQGASEINISCVVRQQDAELGLKRLHHFFFESAE